MNEIALKCSYFAHDDVAMNRRKFVLQPKVVKLETGLDLPVERVPLTSSLSSDGEIGPEN